MSIEGIKSTAITYQSASVTANHQTVDASSAEANKKQMEQEVSVVEKKVEDNSDAKTTLEAVKKAVNELNRQNHNSRVQFGVHEETNRMTIKILDSESRKVIKEFPAEKSLDLIAKAWEMAGIMVDEER